MDIDKDLARTVDLTLVDHKAVFSPQAEDAGQVVGEFYVDGNAVRVGSAGNSAWVTLTEAKHVANKLGVHLQIVG